MLLISEPFQFGSDKIGGNQINLRSGQAKRCHGVRSFLSCSNSLSDLLLGFSFTFKVLLPISFSDLLRFRERKTIKKWITVDCGGSQWIAVDISGSRWIAVDRPELESSH